MSQRTLAVLFPRPTAFKKSTRGEIADELVKDHPAEVWHVMHTLLVHPRCIAIPQATDDEKKRGDTDSCKRRAVFQVRDATPIPGMKIVQM